MSKAYRPSHADATYDFKYGVRSVQVTFCGATTNCESVSEGKKCISKKNSVIHIDLI